MSSMWLDHPRKMYVNTRCKQHLKRSAHKSLHSSFINQFCGCQKSRCYSHWDQQRMNLTLWILWNIMLCDLTNNWIIFVDNWSLFFSILPFLSASYISSASFPLYCVTAPRFCAFSLMPGAAPWICSGMNSVLTSKCFRKRRRKTWFKLI